jgi:hypothetical protein
MGILDGSHLGSLDPATDGLTFTFYGVTSAVIGGTALTGDAAQWSVPASGRSCCDRINVIQHGQGIRIANFLS